MPSEEMRAFNAQARAQMKPIFNANYDPAEARGARGVSDVLKAESTFEDVGAARIEFRPGPESDRLFAYVAGGGFCFGGDDNHRRLVDEIAIAAGARGCLIHHRLAPEAPFPAAFDDVSAAVSHLMERVGQGGLVLGGDSSGGGLVLATVMARLARGAAAPRGLVLLSTLSDLAMTGLSHVANAEADPLFGPQAMIHKGHHYLQGANPTDPRVSPLWGDPTGLPPLLLIAGSTEIMLDDSARFHARARAHGVESQLTVYPEAPHVFPLMEFPESKAARAEVQTFVASLWAGGS